MKQQQKFFRILLICFLALVVLSLSIVLPLALKKDPPDDPPSDSDIYDDESEKFGTKVLFGPYTRKIGEDGSFNNVVHSITIHNEEYEYAFVHPTNKDYTRFVLKIDDHVYNNLTIPDETQVSVLTAIGTAYVQERLFKGEDVKTHYDEYGLGDDCQTYVDMVAYGQTLESVGAQYRVYIGHKTNDKKGYYVRVDGRDAIYVTLTTYLGDFANSSPATYVNPVMLPAEQKQYAYNFCKDVVLSSSTRDTTEGRVISSGDTIRVQQTLTVLQPNGTQKVTKSVKQYNLASSALSSDLKNALIGQTVGTELHDCGYTEMHTVTDELGNPVVIQYQYAFTKIEAVVSEKTEIAFSFIYDATERDYFFQGSLYKIDGPSGLTPYIANGNIMMNMLTLFETLTGEEVVKIGLDEQTINDLGLYHHKLSFQVPLTYEITTVDIPNVTTEVNTILVKNSDFVPVTLYISDLQKGGFYYVGTDYYNMVLKVKAEDFGFVEYNALTWVNETMLCSYMNLVKELNIKVRYDDLNKNYSFRYDLVKTQTNEKGTKEYISVPMNGQEIPYEAFNNLYYRLLWIEYEGVCEISDAEKEAFVAENNYTFQMTIETMDHRTFVYTMIPYTESRCLVTLTDGNSVGQAYFYIKNSTVKEIVYDLLTIENGGIPDIYQKYE